MAVTKLYDVIIAGAGPVGLFLACELGLAKRSVLILERDPKPSSPSEWKSMPMGRRGLNTLSIEILYRRGLLDKLFKSDERQSAFKKDLSKPFQFGGHFAGINLNANDFELERCKYKLNGPALVPGPTSLDRLEDVLTERAESLGVTILRGDGITKFDPEDAESVTVQAGEHPTFRANWLVGCDGGRSFVRKAAGFEFVGTEAKFTGYAVKCEWDHPERLKPGFHHTKEGMYIIGGPSILYLTDFDNGAFDRTQEVTQERVQSIFERISGITDVKITKVHLASTFTDRCKQATTYRKGRVILAGDAAHIHGPVGSQGLNLGLSDAMNLGWKLAATLRREDQTAGPPKDLALLDTYESERHTLTAEVLDWIRVQIVTMQPDAHGAAVQKLVREVLNTTDGTNLFIDRFWGLSQRYILGDGEAYEHPLVGSSAPEFEMFDGERLGEKLKGGKGLLVDFEADQVLKDLITAEAYGDRVDYVGVGTSQTCGLSAILVRPDGIVAWVAEEGATPNVKEAKTALNRWFGV